MTTNASPQFTKAQEKFLNAKDDQERLIFLEEMIREAPKHKSSENLLANLRTRRKKLETRLAKQKKSGKSSRTGIKKEDMQAVIVGKTNSGKSSILRILTNSEPQIADYNFTTKNPIIGIMNYETANIQIIEIPAIGSEFYNRGIPYTADTLLILITSMGELKEVLEELKSNGKKIIVFNKTDLLTENEKRKIKATLQSKKYNFVLTSAITKEGIEELKNKIFQSFDKIRIYTKEPGKEKSKRPIILEPGATAKEVSEKILKGFSEKVKETKIWGPSSKFPGQKIGLSHKLRDLDVVEFKTR